MNTIKEFLKPNLWKVIILFYGTIWFFYSFLTHTEYYEGILGLIGIPAVLLSLPAIAISMIFFGASMPGEFAPKSASGTLFILVIYWYLLSCLIYHFICYPIYFILKKIRSSNKE